VIPLPDINILTNSFNGVNNKYVMGESCNPFDFVYIGSNGCRKTMADSESTIPAIGMCMEAGLGERSILEFGEAVNTAWNLSLENKGLIYASQYVAGGFTQDLSSFREDDVVQILGHAVNSKKMKVHPDYTYVTVGDE
jgi:hypothetical protein